MLTITENDVVKINEAIDVLQRCERQATQTGEHSLSRECRAARGQLILVLAQKEAKQPGGSR